MVWIPVDHVALEMGISPYTWIVSNQSFIASNPDSNSGMSMHVIQSCGSSIQFNLILAVERAVLETESDFYQWGSNFN